MAHTILIIDHDEMALLVRRMVLENASYIVLTATSGAQALQVFATNLVDLVITDRVLLEHSEIAVAAELRRLSPKLPVMTLSGGAFPSDDVKPPDYFLHKLDGPVALVAKVDAMLLATSRG
jgi:two-component system, OmpR family, response regulator CpxR